MKATGIVRKIDPLGRVVIPREICRTHNIEVGETDMEFFTEGDNIIIRKYQPGCIFCGSVTNVMIYKGKNVCGDCMNV